MATRQQESDATRGLTLRELVIEVRDDGKDMLRRFEKHLNEHAESKGQSRGEAKVFGMARSAVALLISLVGIAITVVSAVGPALAGSAK